MKIKNILVIIAVIILLVSTIVIGVYNGFNNSKFFDASISQVLTLVVTLGIAFWATQIKNDQRKIKDHAEIIIQKIQAVVTEDSFYFIYKTDDPIEVQKRISVTNRKLNNCIGILKQYGDRLGFSNDANYIEEEFKSYKTFISDHYTDLDYLEKSESTLRKHAENIDSKCDYIILSLYK